MTPTLATVRTRSRQRMVRVLWWMYGLTYDGLNHFWPYRALVSRVVNRARDEKPAAERIVELGCGTGNVLQALATAFPDARLVGVDLSPTMLRRAARKLRSEHVSLVRKDAVEFLTQADTDSLDLVVLQNVLYAIADRPRLWRELLRTVRPDGVVVITHSDRAGSRAIIEEHRRHASVRSLVHPRLVLVGVIDGYISRLSRTGTFSFVGEHDLARELDEAGAEMSVTERCYGGVNVLFTVTRR